LAVPRIIQPTKLKTFDEVQILRIPEPETGTFLKSRALTIEVFREEIRGDRWETSAAGKPGGRGGRDTEDGGDERMKWKHQPHDHAGHGDGDAEFAEGAIPSPSPDKEVEGRAVHSGGERNRVPVLDGPS
jgi:hypothetical protein